ncbi:MAG: helix-turn-helix domain-containing protein [Rubrobacteraceae bacterium]
MSNLSVEDQGLGEGLLEAEEVASFLGVNPVTVYRWCRQGRLSCLRVGRYWRIRREDLDHFLRQSEQPTTLFGHLESFLRVPDNLIAITQDLELLHRLDAAFFLVGEARGGKLVKFHGGENVPVEELRADLESWGLDVGRLEDRGDLRFIPDEDPEDRENLLKSLLEEDSSGGSSLWASFNWSEHMTLEKALEQQEALSRMASRQLVVKTAALEEAIDSWPPAILRRAQVIHSGQIWLSKAGVSVGRAAPLAD